MNFVRLEINTKLTEQYCEGIILMNSLLSAAGVLFFDIIIFNPF